MEQEEKKAEVASSADSANPATKERISHAWIVWSLDVWGHGFDECDNSLDCPCVTYDYFELKYVHDTDRHECDAEFTVNDRCKVGTVELFDDLEDEQIVEALIEAGWLNELARGKVEIDASTEDEIMVDLEKNGKPIFQLEREICQGHPAGPFDTMGETAFCDGSCRRTVKS